MQILKILALCLLFFFTSAYATALPDAEHPYLKLNNSRDGNVSVYISAYGASLPHKTTNGNVVMLTMVSSNVNTEEHPKGQQYRYIILASCTDKVAKIIPIWIQENESTLPISRYNEDTKDLKEQISNDLNNEESIVIEQGTIIEIMVSAGCSYVGDKLDTMTKLHQEDRRWSI